MRSGVRRGQTRVARRGRERGVREEGETGALLFTIEALVRAGEHDVALPVLEERGGSAGDQGVDRGEREGAAPPWCAVNSLCLLPVHQVFDEMSQRNQLVQIC